MKKLLSLFLLSALISACGAGSNDTADTTPTTDSLDFTYKLTPQSSVFDDLDETEQSKSIESTSSFFNTAHIKSQVFEIDPTIPNTITGENGISVYIPANTFTHKNGTLVTNKISFELKEVITKKDMLMSGLCTVTDDGELLESDGMFYLNATSNGNTLSVCNDLSVSVPTDELKADMLMWQGVEKNGAIVWTDSKELEDPNLERMVLAPNKNSHCDVDPVTDKITAIYANNTCIVPAKVSKAEFELLTYAEMDMVLCGARHISYYADVIEEREENGCSPNKAESFGIWKKSPEGQKPAMVPKEYAERLRFSKLSTGEKDAIIYKDDLTYKLRLNNLGWVNIDRLAQKMPGSKIRKGKILASVNKIADVQSFQICLIVKNRNIFLDGIGLMGDRNHPTFSFGCAGNHKIKIPVGEPAIIIATANTGTKTYFGFAEFTISKDNLEDITLTETSNLDEAINKILN